MDQSVFDSVIADVEKVVNGFTAEDWKNRGLFDRFRELYNMVESYKESEEQKVYLFRRGVLLLAVEAVHDIFPATDYFRKNPEERFTVFRTPGQKKNEGQIDEWINTQEANWARQGEVEAKTAYASKGLWWQ